MAVEEFVQLCEVSHHILRNADHLNVFRIRRRSLRNREGDQNAR